ncbi:MAG: 30S ribosomal protein S18 [Planctomycetota bacterium]|jgi:small subunit ribosomal protein S18
MATFNKKNKKRKSRVKKQEAPKPCRFTKEGTFEIDYRDIELLRRYVSAQGKIHPRKKNNVSAYYQRQLQNAIKRARFLALLPTVGE